MKVMKLRLVVRVEWWLDNGGSGGFERQVIFVGPLFVFVFLGSLGFLMVGTSNYFDRNFISLFP